MLDDRLKRLIERELKELNALLEQSGEMLKVPLGKSQPLRDVRHFLRC